MDEATNQIPEPIDDAQPAPKPPFAWGKFLGYFGAVTVAGLLVGVGAALYVGYRPLERHTQQVVGERITRIEFTWPSINAAPVKRASAATNPAFTAVADDTPAKDAPRKRNTRPAKPAAQPAAPEPAKPEATTWLAPQFQEELTAAAFAALGNEPDPLSREPLDFVADAMERSGWFVGRPVVERRPGGVLAVLGSWRIPAVVVRQGGSDHLLSWDAHPMPVQYALGQSRLPVLVGVSAPRPMRDGKPDYTSQWSGEEVTAGIELFKAIAPQPWFSQVAAVDVATFRENRRLVIITVGPSGTLEGGGRIVWGGRPSKPLPGELPTRRKIERLTELNRKFGRIDGGIDTSTQMLEIFWERPLILNISASAGAVRVEETTP